MSVSGFDKFRLPKEVFASIAITVGAALFLALRTISVPRRFDSWTWVWLATIVYVALHALLIGEPADASLRGVVQLLSYSALLALLVEVLEENAQRKLWLLIGLSMSINGIVTVLQYFGLFPLIELSGGESLGGRATPAGLIGDVNSGAFLFGLVCIISIHGMTLEGRRTTRALWFAVFGCNLAGLAFTRTLTAIAALGLSLLVWLFFHHWWAIRKAKWDWRNLIYLWVMLLLVGVAGSAVAYKAGVFQRVALVSRQMARGNWEVATAGRQPVYSITWRMIQERPWLGAGLNSFGREFFDYRVGTEFGRGQKLINQPGAFQQVHNEYLQLWDEMGAAGLLLFGFLYFGLLWKAGREAIRVPEPDRAYWRGVLVLGGVFVAVSSLTFFPFHAAVTASYAILLLACLRRLTRGEGFPEKAWEPGAAMPSAFLRGWVKPLTVAVLTVGFVATQVKLWRANQEIGLAVFLLEQANSPGTDPRRTRIFADEALTRLERLEGESLRFPEIYNLEGSALMLLGRYDKAVQQYGKATHRLPSPETYTNLAAAYMAAGKPEEARPLLDAALHYNPDYGRARQALEYLDGKNAR